MTKYKIAYVDEEKKEIRNFQRKFSSDFEVEGLLPQKTLEELLDLILKKQVKAVVTDFNLAEYKTDVKYPVLYDGVDLVQAIRDIREGFPCFILTSFDGDAIQESEDVNLIYPKAALNQQIGNTTLQEKVNVQIQHYDACIKQAATEFDALVEKARTGDLTEKEEVRLQELDGILEKSLNAKRSLPSTAKQGKGLQKLGELLRSTEALLQELRKEKKR